MKAVKKKNPHTHILPDLQDWAEEMFLGLVWVEQLYKLKTNNRITHHFIFKRCKDDTSEFLKTPRIKEATLPAAQFRLALLTFVLKQDYLELSPIDLNETDKEVC